MSRYKELIKKYGGKFIMYTTYYKTPMVYFKDLKGNLKVLLAKEFTEQNVKNKLVVV